MIFQTVPVPGAREVFSLEVGPDSLVYGLTSGPEFFVFDQKGKKVVHRENLAVYGSLPRPALLRDAEAMHSADSKLTYETLDAKGVREAASQTYCVWDAGRTLEQHIQRVFDSLARLGDNLVTDGDGG